MKILITGGSGFIGTNLVSFLLTQRIDLMNLDISPPKIGSHGAYWRKCDILDQEAMVGSFAEYLPTHVVHLAARTDTAESSTLADYRVNTEGTANVLEAIKSSPTVKRAIITSTQFVHQYHGVPQHDEEYKPYTSYGQSKVIMEQMTRKANLTCDWIIIRPTNIWGPWHPRYPQEFWLVLKKGMYIHPGRKAVVRSYGYVGNVVFQIMQLLSIPAEPISRGVFYVGDRSINLRDWANGFSKALTGREVRVVPRIVVRSLAFFGDVLTSSGIRFPITSSRYFSMTTGNEAPMDKTFRILGEPPYSLAHGIAETVEWLVQQDPAFWGST